MKPNVKLNADQIIQFAEQAILKILDARRYGVDQVNIDKQISEASFVYRRVMEYMCSPGTRLDYDNVKRLQVCMCILWTFITLVLDFTLSKQDGQIASLRD